jgi:hypothetical protein
MPLQFLLNTSAYTKQKLSDVTRKSNDANFFRKRINKFKSYNFNLYTFFRFYLSIM